MVLHPPPPPPNPLPKLDATTGHDLTLFYPRLVLNIKKTKQTVFSTSAAGSEHPTIKSVTAAESYKYPEIFLDSRL